MTDTALTENEEIAALLIETLRRPAEISFGFRLSIADMLDPLGSGPFQLKLSSRKRGRPQGSWTDNSGAALLVRKLVAEGVSRQRAIHQACEQFKISERTVEKAMERLSIMLAEQEAFDAMRADRPTAK